LLGAHPRTLEERERASAPDDEHGERQRDRDDEQDDRAALVVPAARNAGDHEHAEGEGQQQGGWEQAPRQVSTGVVRQHRREPTALGPHEERAEREREEREGGHR
jgi:hypothetical protein